MIPIRDHNPSERTPYVTYALMAANIAIFISYADMMYDPRAINAFFQEWAMIPAYVTAHGDYASMFTSMFLHGGWLHLAGNMLFLWIFGDNMEDEMGHLNYLGFYILGGLGAALIHVLSDPTSMVPTVGASGAIAAVMGGYLLMFPKARVDILIIIFFYIRILPVPAYIMLGLWFGFQVLQGATADLAGGGVAYWAHAGGFLVGIALTLPLFMKRGGTAYWSRTAGHPPHPEAAYKLGKSRIPVVRRK